MHSNNVIKDFIHQRTAITFDKEQLKKQPAKFWFGNFLQLHFIKNYLRITACKILLWKKQPGNFVPMFPCLCTPVPYMGFFSNFWVLKMSDLPNEIFSSTLAFD